MAGIFAKNAHEMGVEAHCFAWEKGAVAKNIVDYFYPISIFEKELILEKCREIGADGVVATTELTIPIVAYLSERLHLNGISYEIAKNLTNKYRNRLLTMNIDGLNHPKFALVSSKEDILKSKIQPPFILKPNNLGGEERNCCCKTIR